MKAEHPRTWDETDVFSKWGRKYLCMTPQRIKSVKQRSHRIDRQQARRAVKKALDSANSLM